MTGNNYIKSIKQRAAGSERRSYVEREMQAGANKQACAHVHKHLTRSEHKHGQNNKMEAAEEECGVY